MSPARQQRTTSRSGRGDSSQCQWVTPPIVLRGIVVRHNAVVVMHVVALLLLLCMSSLLLCCNSLRCTHAPLVVTHKRTMALSPLYMRAASSSTAPVGKISIRTINADNDLTKAAAFLSQSMYEKTIENDAVPVSLSNELARLERKDLIERYGETVGKKFYPSAFIVIERDSQIIGAVGLDSQAFNCMTNKFRKVYPLRKALTDKESVVLVLGNLAVRPDSRKLGLAKTLLAYCETLAEGWGYKEIYLLVDQSNAPARTLYKKRGYRDVFLDEDATCIVSSNYKLRTEPCVNVCMRKSLVEDAKEILGGSNPLTGLFGAFQSLFKKP